MLGNRTPYAWGTSTGIGRGAAQRLADGLMPGGQLLARIARVENLSITWLLTGAGTPYLVYRADTDADAARHLHALLDEDGWTINLVASDAARALVLTQPASIDRIDYTIVEVLAGPLAERTVSLADRAPSAGRWQHTVSAGDLRRLAAGQFGSWALLRPGGLLSQGREVAQFEIEAPTSPPAPEQDEADSLVQAWRRLDPPLRRVAAATLGALEAAQREGY